MIIIGHRGACGYEADNTIKSFEKAIELGADYVELDAQKTLDDKIVVFHDKRLFDKIPIEEISLLDLKQEALKAGVGIPTLGEVFEFINDRIGINIEVKSKMPADLIIKEIRKYKCDIDKIIVSSFLHDCLFELRENDSQIKIGVLLDSKLPDPFDILDNLQSKIIIQKYEHIGRNYVDMLHNRNIEIFVWTVNEPEDIKKMVELNVDGIISDFPDRARSLL